MGIFFRATFQFSNAIGLSRLGLPLNHVPWVSKEPAYKTYFGLRRFGNALVLDELRKKPTFSLSKFIGGFRLEGYVPPASDSSLIKP